MRLTTELARSNETKEIINRVGIFIVVWIDIVCSTGFPWPSSCYGVEDFMT